MKMGGEARGGKRKARVRPFPTHSIKSGQRLTWPPARDDKVRTA